MFELLGANCAELSYEEVLSDIPPPIYDRDDLPCFYELALYKTISWWIDAGPICTC